MSKKMLSVLGILVLLGVSGPACTKPQTSNQDTLAQAVIAAHKAAAPAARQMVEEAKAAVAAAANSPNAKVAAATVTNAQAQVVIMDAAVKRYESLISTEDWQERLVPLLREALQGYQRLIDLGFPLPAVPRVVQDLLLPCSV